MSLIWLHLINFKFYPAGGFSSVVNIYSSEVPWIPPSGCLLAMTQVLQALKYLSLRGCVNLASMLPMAMTIQIASTIYLSRFFSVKSHCSQNSFLLFLMSWVLYQNLFSFFFLSNNSNLGVAWIFSRIFWLNQHFALACCCYTILCATLH